MVSSRQFFITLAFCAALSTALPWGEQDQRDSCEENGTPSVPLNEVVNTGPSPLPMPTGTPKYIDLGLGFQNYTCNAKTKIWVQTVPSSGAIANLYDITSLVYPSTRDSLTRNTLKTFEQCLALTDCHPSTANDYCNTCHQIAAAPFQPARSGLHFFNQFDGVQVPNFDICARGDFLSAKKVGDVRAPATAYAGEDRLGAIDWLYLVDNASGRTHGLKSVYRVETASGAAPASCDQPDAQLQVPYAAEYWFYD